MEDQSQIKTIERQREFPSVPQTVAQVLAYSKDDDASLDDLARIVDRDPSLLAKTLRMAASPYFYRGWDIVSSREAVETIGWRGIMGLALTSTIFNMAEATRYSIDPKRFYKHSIEVAVAARKLAWETGYMDAGEAYACGLLHDVGVLLLQEWSSREKFREFCERMERGDAITDAEVEALGMSHTEAGLALMTLWRMPAVICQAVGQHHSALLLQDIDRDARMQPSRIIALANLLSQYGIFMPLYANDRHVEAMETLRETLGIEPRKLEDIALALPAMTEREASFLGLDVGGVDRLSEEALEVVSRQFQEAGMDPEPARDFAEMLGRQLWEDEEASGERAWNRYGVIFSRLLEDGRQTENA